MATLSTDQMAALSFKSIGKNCLISNKASFYNCGNISIGNNVRIDDFCILSAGDGGISIGNFIHVAPYTSLIGQGRITLQDFSNLSSKVTIYSSNDDYSGEHMTNPMIDPTFTNVTAAPVMIGKHVIIGSGTTILPGTKLAEGVAIGAMSLVNRSCERFTIHAGIPIKKRGTRKGTLTSLEQQFLDSRS